MSKSVKKTCKTGFGKQLIVYGKICQFFVSQASTMKSALLQLTCSNVPCFGTFRLDMNKPEPHWDKDNLTIP